MCCLEILHKTCPFEDKRSTCLNCASRQRGTLATDTALGPRAVELPQKPPHCTLGLFQFVLYPGPGWCL